MRASINDASVYDDNFTLLQKIRELSRRVTALENGGGGGGGSYTLPTASSYVKGGIKVGANLYMDGEYLNATGGSYDLPVASSDTLGGVMVGDGLSIDDAGVLSANGGGGGGYVCYTDMMSIANPVDNDDILLGYVTNAEVERKDYTTAITYTNEDDPTDIISVYLKNSSAGYDLNDKEAYISAEDDGYIPMIKNPNSGEVTPVYGDFLYCYGLRHLSFYDTASQEDAQPIYSTNAQPLQTPGRIYTDYDANDAYYLKNAYGWINFEDYPIYIDDKTYKSQDSVQLSSIVGTANASGEGADVSLYGTWLRQQSV